jgi:nucleotide-binding universal stress UspA family protein
MAVLLARIAEAELTILHITIASAPRNSLGRSEARGVAAFAEAEGHRLLASAGQVAAGQVPYRLELGAGDPAAAICRRARELGADLIVTGDRGLDSLDRLFLGSVSASVAQRAHCSVLVVRQPQAGVT